MKNNIVFLFLLFSLCSFAQQNNPYANGWTDGWKGGYCYEIDPSGRGCTITAPIAPNPRNYGAGYQEGYNNGFVAGKRYYRENNQIRSEVTENGGRSDVDRTSIFYGYRINFNNSLEQTIAEINNIASHELQRRNNQNIGSQNNGDISAQTQQKIAEVRRAYYNRR